jgi:Tol biopolymer transport system component
MAFSELHTDIGCSMKRGNVGILMTGFLLRLLIIALMVSSCSIELEQTSVSTPARSTEIAPVPSSNISITQVPMTWTNLNLTGKLIYVSSVAEGDRFIAKIYILDLLTGGISEVFSMPDAWVYYATVSPDTSALVMSYTPPTQPNISSARILYSLPLDASTPPQPLFTPPTGDDRYVHVEWSPDGEFLYYAHYNNKVRLPGQLDPVYDIVRMKYPDGEPEKIAEHAFWPRISPDSKKVVYISIDPESGRNELYVANADGSIPEQITFSNSFSPEIIDAPIFSPDGQSILFSVPSLAQSYQPNWFEKLLGIEAVSAHDVPSDWWSVPVTGGVPTQLTNIQTINLFASISPDEKHVASVSGEGLFVMSLDGSGLTQLLLDPGVHGTVNWTP